MRDLPAIDAQRQAISRWLIKFGGRRPSEAAMEVSGMSAARRRKLFRHLRDLKCIAYDVTGDGSWQAVRGVPTYEQAVVNDEDAT